MFPTNGDTIYPEKSACGTQLAHKGFDIYGGCFLAETTFYSMQLAHKGLVKYSPNRFICRASNGLV
jgi:hypothetical protein